MIDSKENIVTSEDLIASVMAESPLVAVQIIEKRQYSDMQDATWRLNGYLTGVAYDKLRMELNQTAEGLFYMLQKVQMNPNDKQGSLLNQDIVFRVRSNMVHEMVKALDSVAVKNVKDYEKWECMSCTFKLILPGSFPKYDLFDWKAVGGM